MFERDQKPLVIFLNLIFPLFLRGEPIQKHSCLWVAGIQFILDRETGEFDWIQSSELLEFISF